MWKIFDHNHSFEDAQILPQWCKAIFKRKRCFKNQLYQISHMFTYTGGKPQKRRYCEKCRKYFTKTTDMKRHKFCHRGGQFYEKLFPKPTSQMTHMFYLHRRKDLQTHDCDICGKCFTKNTVTMMHKFRHWPEDAQIQPQWGEAILK